MQIRPYRPSDGNSLFAAVDSVCRESPWMSTAQFIPTTAWLHALSTPDCPCHHLLVVEDWGTIVGWCRLFPDWGKSHINQVELGIGLLKPYRCRGIGTRLVQYSLDWIELKALKATLSVNENNLIAQHLFCHAGFRTVRRNEELICMDYQTPSSLISSTRYEM